MSKISMLRTIVNNGWTIANRRTIVSKLGKSCYNEISNLAQQAGITETIKCDEFIKKNLSLKNIAMVEDTLSKVIPSKYQSLDKILNTTKPPKSGEYGFANISCYVDSEGDILRDIQANGEITPQVWFKNNFRDCPNAKEYIKDIIATVKRQMKTLPETKQECILWKGVSLNETQGSKWSKLFGKIIKNAKVGDVITPDYAAVSTSAAPGYALSFARNNTKDTPTLLKIIVKPGNKLSSRGGGDGISPLEIDLPPMSSYKVLNKQIVQKDSKLIELYTLEYIPPKYLTK